MIMFYGAEFTVQYALVKHEKIQLGKYGEPAIYQEMEKLEKKVQIKEEKRIIDKLKENLRFAKKSDKNKSS